MCKVPKRYHHPFGGGSSASKTLSLGGSGYKLHSRSTVDAVLGSLVLLKVLYCNAGYFDRWVLYGLSLTFFTVMLGFDR